MKYSEYMKLMNQMAGVIDPKMDPRVTIIDLELGSGPGKEGNATVYLIDGQPAGVAWYDWDLRVDYLVDEINKAVAPFKVELANGSGGNGHYYNDLKILE